MSRRYITCSLTKKIVTRCLEKCSTLTPEHAKNLQVQAYKPTGNRHKWLPVHQCINLHREEVWCWWQPDESSNPEDSTQAPSKQSSNICQKRTLESPGKLTWKSYESIGWFNSLFSRSSWKCQSRSSKSTNHLPQFNTWFLVAKANF